MTIESKHTRESLLGLLKECQKKLYNYRSCIDREKGMKEPQQSLIDSWYADEWLMEQSVKLIEEALINNELKDY